MKNSKLTFKLPDNLKILLLGEVYDIKFVDLEDEDLGEIDYDNKVIKLSPSVKDKPEELEYVFYHEIAHYFSHLAGIGDDECFASFYSYFLIAILNQVEYKQK